ncbi:extensin family protein [Litoreibacter halocynthiae]|nr:extensin family protein [Litoreibacter halocynthiae]
MNAKTSKRVAKGLQGSVCGNPNIRGEKISRIPAKLRGCGLDNGVKVTEVSGVALTQHAKIDCNTAKALNTWVERGVKPAVGRRGGGVKSLKVVAHYACRTRNNQKGAKVSEHGRGRAVDIAAINLKDGSSMTVLKGWRSAKNGPALKKMHKAACGPFGTVLGPNANRFHQDHFHFDTARYRSGTYCR